MKTTKQFILSLSLLAASSAVSANYAQPMLLASSYPSPNVYYIAYFDFMSGTASVVPNNSYLEYDVFLPVDSADFSGGVDFTHPPNPNNTAPGPHLTRGEVADFAPRAQFSRTANSRPLSSR